MSKEVECSKKKKYRISSYHDAAQAYMDYWINVMAEEKAEEKLAEKLSKKAEEENNRKIIIHGLELGLDAEAICGFNEDISKELIQKVAEENREELIRRGVEFPLKI